MSGEHSKKAKKRCYAKHHMTMKMHSLYQHAIEVSFKSGIFYFNGEDIAEKVYTRTSKSSVYRVFKELVKAGWFVERGKPRQRQADGTYASTKVYVLTHDVWVQNHGSHECRIDAKEGRVETGEPIPENLEAEEPEPEPTRIHKGPVSIPKDGTGEEGDPFPSTGITIPKDGSHHSQVRESPFPKEGRSIVGEYCTEALSRKLCAEPDKTPAASASPQNQTQNLPAPGGDAKSFVKRMSDSELVKEFRESDFSWHDYDKFTSSDPEAWSDLTRRRTNLASPLIRLLKQEHQLSFDAKDERLFAGLLLRIPVEDDELTIHTEGNLIQHAINEAMKGVSGQNVNHLRFLLNTRFEDYRKTYTALRDEKLLEPQPLEGVQ